VRRHWRAVPLKHERRFAMETRLKKPTEAKKSEVTEVPVAVLQRKAPRTGTSKLSVEHLRRIRERTLSDPIWRQA